LSEYHFNLPISKDEVKKLRIGDVIYISGDIFTARDAAHELMLKKPEDFDFKADEMALYHCGPLMQKKDDKWVVVSAGPTTSIRMELFEDQFIEKFGIKLIIGKGFMGEKTKKALQKYTCIYTSYTGGAGALAADCIKKVKKVIKYEELGMAEAIWIFKVEKFGPLIVSMDTTGKTLFKKGEKNI